MVDKKALFIVLRAALNHLYDPEYLEKSPLIRYLGIESRFDAASVIHKKLIDAIEELRPKAGIVKPAYYQQIYDILIYRYVQKLSQEEISHQFGISERQLRREQNRAIMLLATSLMQRSETESKSFAVSGKDSNLSTQNSDESIEFPWIKLAVADYPTDLSLSLSQIEEVISPLATRVSTDLSIQFEDGLQPIAIHPLAFRQIILSIMDQAIQACTAGRVQLRAKKHLNQVTIIIDGCPKPPNCVDHLFDMKLVQKIVSHYMSKFEYQISPHQVQFMLSFPVLKQITVLLIDDNQDIQQLFQRYVEGTIFQIVSASQADEIFSTIDTVHPNIIILDVMMPAIDGWEVLLRIRKNPSSRQTPVVICSILNQEELAYSLGATEYLHKPVRQADLLEVLNRLMMREEREQN